MAYLIRTSRFIKGICRRRRLNESKSVASGPDDKTEHYLKNVLLQIENNCKGKMRSA